MNKQINNKQSGFTIIEVVLVLAIAALIFLIVFLAVPALQRSQRDTQRRNDMSRFMSQLQNYQSNNKGKLPGTNTATLGTDFVAPYLTGPDQWADPQAGSYTVAYSADLAAANGGDSDAVGEVAYFEGGKCDGEKIVAGSARQAAIRTKLEGAGYHCLNN